MSELLIALGANLLKDESDLASTLSRAIGLLEDNPQIEVVRRSRWYRTPAYPPGSGPDFVNGAAALKSDLRPCEILQILHEVEAVLGRERRQRWAPRVCDLDLLAAGELVQPDAASVRNWMELDDQFAQVRAPDHLILPHPRLHMRAFVLVPLNDIASTWRHPILQLTVSELLARLSPQEIAEVNPLD